MRIQAVHYEKDSGRPEKIGKELLYSDLQYDIITK